MGFMWSEEERAERQQQRAPYLERYLVVLMKHVQQKGETLSIRVWLIQ